MSFEHVNKQLSTEKGFKNMANNLEQVLFVWDLIMMQNCILTGRTSCSCFQFFGSVSNQINICHQIKANGVDMGF